MLKKSPHLFKISFRISELIKDNSDLLLIKKGQSIFTEGSTPLGIYFINEGKVKICKIGCHGKEQVLKISTKKEILSVSDLLSGSKYNNSAIALEDTSLLFIHKHDFGNLLVDEPEIMEQFLRKVSRELSLAETRLVHFAYKPVRGRLADAIISLDEIFNRYTMEYEPVVISRLDLAGYVGTVHETASRLLSEFKAEKLIDVHGHKIKIRDLNGLKKISNMYN
ncbi:MAG: Crp/Fnr family transcriptional regulator [Gillisia sp.]|nr:Crp/Fnr family transcriptional regulator [Gillisia sp.]